VVLEPALRELLCGAVEGWSVRKVEARYPREWARNADHSDPTFRWPGGESYLEFRERIMAGIMKIVARHPNERIMAVTHAGVISQLIGWTMGDHPARWDLYRPRNASVSELLWHTDHADVLRFDDCPGATRC
jgi:broad specificity phosphatase PhoE